jgi:PKD repeat protein
VTDNEELKFTPDEAEYGLVFDATSSTPTGGAQFIETEWDFGNGIERSYRGAPKIERVKYVNEGEYDVTLRLRTNEGKVVEREFVVAVYDPIAKIEVNKRDGYIGEQFTFSARAGGFTRNLSYSWEIIDIENDRIVASKSDRTFTHTFVDKGIYNVQLRVRQSSGQVDQDTHIIYINSQAPIAEFETSIPASHKPNRVFIDGSRSYDPDVSDDGRLEYTWFIDGNRVNLEDATANGSVGYYTFASVGNHSITLEVTDPDGIMTTKQDDITIDSILSVEMFAFPRVIQRGNFIRFTAESPEAEVYEWDFGDGTETGGNFDTVTHTYNTSGTFEVELTVQDGENNTNSFRRTVYVSDSDAPFAMMDISYGNMERPLYDEAACDGVG